MRANTRILLALSGDSLFQGIPRRVMQITARMLVQEKTREERTSGGTKVPVRNPSYLRTDQRTGLPRCGINLTDD